MIIDGRKLAHLKEVELQKHLAQLSVAPKLVVILVGDDSASKLYVSLKQQVAKKVGIKFELHSFSTSASLQSIEAIIKAKNADSKTTGILLQLPIHLDEPNDLVNQIDPEKDVDCLTNYNLSRLAVGKALFLPAALKAVLTIIKNLKFKIKNSSICVVGATGFIGQPLADYLEFLGGKVDRCHSQTLGLAKHTHEAEILISATGVPRLITLDMVKPGALVIDIGSPVGDVDFAQVKTIAGAVTPVPGGVGPLTVISLLENAALAVQS